MNNASFQDVDMSVRVLRERRPRVLLGMVIAFVSAALCGLLTLALGDVALFLCGGCVAVGMVQLGRLIRIEHKLEELER